MSGDLVSLCWLMAESGSFTDGLVSASAQLQRRPANFISQQPPGQGRVQATLPEAADAADPGF